VNNNNTLRYDETEIVLKSMEVYNIRFAVVFHLMYLINILLLLELMVNRYV
jgi:hypothetical protein